MPACDRNANRIDLRPCRGDVCQNRERHKRSRFPFHQVAIYLIEIVVELLIPTKKVIAKAEETNLFDRVRIRRKILKIGEAPPLLCTLSLDLVALMAVENLRSN